MSRARFQAGISSPPAHSSLDSANLAHSLIAPAVRERFLASDISDTLQEVAKSDPFSRLKPYQLDILYSPLPQVGDDKAAIAAFLRQWFDIFNTAFFGGGLTALRDQIYLYDTFPQGPRATARYDHINRLRPDGELHINLSSQGTERSKEERFVGNMAHEMTHAFFGYYGCLCSSCDQLVHPSRGGEGLTGHGPAWIEAMIAIGQAIQDEVRWTLWVGLNGGIQAELDRVQEWKPTEAQLIRWEIRGDFKPDLTGGARKVWGQSNPRRDQWGAQKAARDKQLQRQGQQGIENDERIRRETELQEEAQEEADQRHRKEGERRRQEEERRRLGNTRQSREDEERRKYAHEEAQRRLKAEPDERSRIANQPPQMNPRREQSVPQHHQDPPRLPAPAPSSSGTNPFARRGAEMVQSQQQLAAVNSNATRRRPEDPEVANERTLRGRIGKVSQRLFGWNRK